jgi:YjbE family integral membrane protein
MDADPSIISFNVILGVLLADILLSGDNAIVIALVCRGLPKHQQTRVMWLGILGAFMARLLLTSVATLAMQLPLIKLVGGLLLLKISVELIVDNINPKRTLDEPPQAGRNIFEAATTIVLADIVMSLDNVLALSAVTQNNFQMLVLGLVLSMPILMFGSLYISKLLDMFPIFLWVGAGILGGVAGGLLIDDPVFGGLFSGVSSMSHFVVPLLAAVFVVQISRVILSNRSVLENVPRPPSLYQIFGGARHPAAFEQASVPSAPPVPVVTPAPKTVAARSEAKEVAPSLVVVEPMIVSEPVLVEGKPNRDYRVVAALGLFLVVVGWAIYAMVNADPPPVPDRLAGYKCKDPALVVQYRASAKLIRFASPKGVVDARTLDDRIVWDDYALATKTLNLNPPLKITSAQPEQLEFLGGDFDHVVCVASGR